MNYACIAHKHTINPLYEIPFFPSSNILKQFKSDKVTNMIKPTSLSLGSTKVRFSERNYVNANTFYIHIKSNLLDLRLSANTLSDLIQQIANSTLSFSLQSKITTYLRSR